MDERNTLILSSNYIREQVEKKAIQLEYCESKNMVADILTICEAQRNVRC